jgi:similar to spore coat protein
MKQYKMKHYIVIDRNRRVEIMEHENLAPNETMQVHEILNFKTISMSTSKMMEGVVFDQDLKALLERDVQQSILSIQELQKLISKAPILR